VNRRFVRILVHVLIAAQVLLGAPVVNAYVGAVAASSQAGDTHCADMAPDEGDAAPCPCCPEGITDMTSCFTSCLATPAAVHSFAFVPASREFAAADSAATLHTAALAEPPLKPPPIV
jgi:hypothetical protein